MTPTNTVANSMFGDTHVKNSRLGEPCRSVSGMNSAPPGSMATTASPYTPSRTSPVTVRVSACMPAAAAGGGVGAVVIEPAFS